MNHREKLIERVCAGYRATYGEEPLAVFSAPGRVNLIGEHTDYNQGLVLPCAIDRETMIAAGAGADEAIEAVALDLDGASDSFGIREPIAVGTHEWSNHLRGVAHFLGERGVKLPSARLAISGNVPMGAGLSSSASLGVVTGLALSTLAGESQAPATLARVAQQAENHFVGTQCGIMDQMASACARGGHALLLDCRDLTYRHVALPDSLALIIIDSGVQHSLGDSPYNERRAQCEAVAEHFGAASLRDVSLEQLESESDALGKLEFRRARHVITEIARVDAFAEALRRGDRPTISHLMRESFVSYRDDFEASVPAVDRLFEIISGCIGEEGGVRLTGGGFGGSLVALAPHDLLGELEQVVEREYNRIASTPARAGVFQASSGALEVPI